MAIFLELETVTKHYGTHKAVDGISCKVEQGDIFGLLGPNGAGKTTLIRMITGIVPPDSGTIRIDGRLFDPSVDPYSMGYMPEERGLYKKMKVGDQALYLARLKGMAKNDALDALKTWFVKFGMETWWDKKVEDLSKGMAQKLQFVTTVLHAPQLIILDEPFSGLDPLNSNLIKEEIFRLAQQGHTVIFSTHRMEQVEEICGSILLVNLGKKVLEGNVDEIKQRFKENIFEIGFDRPVALPDEEPGMYRLVSSAGNKSLLRLADGLSANDILLHFIQKGEKLSSFHEVLPSLNDIFLRSVSGTGAVARAFG